jgi:hypothetical protein
MKTLLAILLLVSIACGQYADTTMNILVTVPAPQGVIDQIDEVRTYIEVRPQGQTMLLYTGMTLAEAEALQGTLVQTTLYGQGIGQVLPASGEQYNVCVFGLNQGNEIIHTIGFDRYFLRSGASGVGTLPLLQTITDNDIYIQVNVDFQ